MTPGPARTQIQSPEFRFVISHSRCDSRRTFHTTVEGFNRYFEGGCQETCSCGAEWINVFVEHLLDWSDFGGITDVLGGVFKEQELTIAPTESKTVSLDDMGVPHAAEILEISFLMTDPSAAWKPAIGFEKSAHWDPMPRTFEVHSVPAAEAHLHESGEIHPLLRVRYVAPGFNELPVRHLCDAGRHFTSGRYASMVVSANVAVEAALAPAMRQWIRLTCSGDDADKLLGKDGISYARQIILTKMASKALNIADLPGRVRRLLDDLRDQRNSIVHTGAPKGNRAALNKDRAAELLAAAAFGYQYARYLRDEVSKRADGEGAGKDPPLG